MGRADINGPSTETVGGPDARGKTLFVGIAALVGGLFVLFVLIPRTIGPIGSGATFLAMIGAGAMAVLGIILTVTTLRRPLPTVAHVSGDPGRTGKAQAIGLVLIALAYAWGLDWLGFLLASYLALAALLVLMGVRSVLVVLALPAGVVLAIYLGIDVALGAPLPEGRFDWPILSALTFQGGAHVNV